jgi:hypothetical protein
VSTEILTQASSSWPVPALWRIIVSKKKGTVFKAKKQQCGISLMACPTRRLPQCSCPTPLWFGRICRICRSTTVEQFWILLCRWRYKCLPVRTRVVVCVMGSNPGYRFDRRVVLRHFQPCCTLQGLRMLSPTIISAPENSHLHWIRCDSSFLLCGVD